MTEDLSNNTIPDEDLFIAKKIAERIEKKIDGHDRSKEAYVVSVYGEWGAGKTRCLRLIEDYFAQRGEFADKALPANSENSAKLKIVKSSNQETTDNKIPRLVLPIFFSAWMYEKEAHLVIPLLRTIEVALAKHLAEINNSTVVDGQNKPSVRERFSLLSSIFADKFKNTLNVNWGSALVKAGKFGINTVLPGAGEFFNLLEKVFEVVELKTEAESGSKEKSQKVGNLNPSDLPPESLYYNFHSELADILAQEVIYDEKKCILRLVVLVDDLDRCLPDKAIEMLESIKLFMNVPGFSFVLAVDDDVVERGIRHRYAGYLADMAQSNIAHNDNSVKSTLHYQKNSTLPITGNEYLEKIVHLPQHLNRLSEKEARKILNAFPLLANNQAIQDLIIRTVPCVPRKLIRLSEALEFQYACLTDGNDTDIVDKSWPLLAAARTTILAQIYPEVYRLLRQGDIRQFWLLLYSIEQDEVSGEPIYTDCTVRENNKEVKKDNPDGKNSSSDETSFAGKAAENMQKIWLSYTDLQEYAERQTRYKIGEEQDKHVNDQKIHAFKFMEKSQQNIREVLEFMQAVYSSCQTRNGWGLLHFWSDEERKNIANLPMTKRALRIMGTYELPLLESDYRNLLFDYHWQAPIKIVEIEANAPSEVGVRKVEGDVEWLDAVLGPSQKVLKYFGRYQRMKNEAADNQSYIELLDKFCLLTAKQRQELCNHAWRVRVEDLMSPLQARYLTEQLGHGWIASTDKVDRQRFIPSEEEDEQDKDKKIAIITDQLTGLVWKQLSEKDADGKLIKIKAKEALELNKKLNPGNNENTWRLPMPRELQSLVDYSESSPAIDKEIFPDTASDWYWTSSPVEGSDKSRAWVVGFGSGLVGGNFHDVTGCVRLVRGSSRSVI